MDIAPNFDTEPFPNLRGRSILRKPGRARLVLLLGGIVLLAVVVVLPGHRTNRPLSKPEANAQSEDLKQALAEADRLDPGWRLEELEARRAVFPDPRKNSGVCVQNAMHLLPKPWPAPHSLDDLNSLGSVVRLTQEQADRIQEDLDHARTARDEALRLADLPAGRYRVIWAKDFISTPVDHLTKARTCLEVLRLEALRRAHVWDSNRALRACRAMLNAGGSIGDEPYSISQLVRLIHQVLAARTLERILAQGEPAEEGLAITQKLFAKEVLHSAFLIMMRGERIFQHIAFTGLTEGTMSWSKDLTVGEKEKGKPEERAALDRRMGQAARRYHPRATRFATQAVEIAKRPAQEWQRRLKDLFGSLKDVPDPEQELFWDPTKLVAAPLRAQALLRSAVVGLALERYRRRHRHWPAKLTELTPNLLAAIPLDPYDGVPLRFRRLVDGVVVYSIGPDGKDDGGKVHPLPNAFAPAGDIGFRLWDVAHRRQAPNAKRQAGNGAEP